jgi:energy-coupling factor transporter transmembrane protein EcfT
MTPAEHQPGTTLQALRRFNRLFLVVGSLSLLLSLALASTALAISTTPLLVLLILVCALIVAVRSRLPRTLGVYILSVVMGVLLVWGVALWSFYRPNITVLDDRTGAPDKSIGSALAYTAVGPEFYTMAAVFQCDTAQGPECAGLQRVLGVGLDYAILTSGVITGTMLGRRQTQQP